MNEENMSFEQLARIRNKEDFEGGFCTQEEYLDMEKILDTLKDAEPCEYTPLN